MGGLMEVWMDEWMMDGWMDGWVGGWIDGWMDCRGNTYQRFVRLPMQRNLPSVATNSR